MYALKRIKSLLLHSKENFEHFFTSHIFKEHFAGISNIISKRYSDERIVVNTAWSNDGRIAYTNNKEIYINFNNPLFRNLMLDELYYAGLGLLGHETGHIIFTNFHIIDDYKKNMQNENWYQFKVLKNKKEIQCFKEDAKNHVYRYFIMDFISMFSNLIEDFYIDNIMPKLYEGTFSKGIKYLRKVQFDNASFIVQGIPHLDINNYLLFSVYSNFEDKNFLKEYPEIKKAQKLIKEMHEDNRIRFIYAIEIVAMFWKYIKKFIDSYANNFNQMPMPMSISEKGTGEGIVSKSGAPTPGSSTSSSSNSSSLKDLNNQTASQKDTSNNGQQTGSDSESGSDNNQNADNKDSNNTKTNASNSNKETEKNNSSNEKKSDNSSSDKNEGNTSNNQKENNTAGNQGITNQKDTANANQSLDELLSKYITYNAKNSSENINKLVDAEVIEDAIKDSCHKTYPYKIHTKHCTERSLYYDIMKYILPISKRLQRKFVDLFDVMEGGSVKNLLKGTKINPAAAANCKGRVFKRNIFPEEQDVVVSVLIDQSGSMSGERLDKAKEMAILVTEFCNSLEIPISITGHCDMSGAAQIYKYISFDDKNSSKFSIPQMSANGCNRDGLALRYCLGKLKYRDEQNKLMIIISDGRPNSENYNGTIAYNDLKQIKAECKRNNIVLIAAAIGNDKEIIKKIYGDSFLDISDLNTLPIRMIKLISKYI